MAEDFSRYFKFDEKFEIKIDREGRWFHNGQEITHPGVYKYLNSLLDVDEKGYFLNDRGRKFYIEVEDAPFVVKSIVEKNGKVYVVLNDDTEEEFDPETLEIKGEDVFYIRVKNGKFPARFSRKAQTQLYDFVKEESDNYFLEINGKKVKLDFT